MVPQSSDEGRNPLEPEEERRLYEARKAARASQKCDPDPKAHVPDSDPKVTPVPCEEPEEPPEVVFQPANVPPDEPIDPNQLPLPISLYSREFTFQCPVGQVAVVGSSPTTAPMGQEIQLVYLDDLAIQQSELFRLAGRVDDVQAYTDANLISALDGGTEAAFDQGLSALVGVVLEVATSIRVALAQAQSLADTIVQTTVLSAVTCGWENRELWVVCSEDNPLGYDAFYSDPGLGPAEQVRVSAGEVTSVDSQDDADLIAARQGAIDLDCLVGNDVQSADCADVSPSFDATLEWPDTPWDSGTWETTSPIHLSQLDGQPFLTERLVGTGEKRTLKYAVTVQANDPRAAAPSKAEANEIAQGIALQELDCFFPSRPRMISCALTSQSVQARMAAKSYTEDQVFAEMSTGDSGGDHQLLNPDNEGILDPGTPDETVDTRLAYRVESPAGIVVADDPDDANDQAQSRASAYLYCFWISPQHTCTCVGDVTTQAVSSKFTTAQVTTNNANFRAGESTPNNVLERGQFIDANYPGAAIGDNVVWPDLIDICQASLTCIFDSCRVVYCEPKPDTRKFKINGMSNFASWGETWLDGPSTADQQAAFIAAWEARLGDLSTPGTAIYDTYHASGAQGGVCPGYADADECDAGNNPDNVIAKGPELPPTPGTGVYGTPARFKFGGVLKLEHTWGNPADIGATGTGPGARPDIPSAKGVLDCSLDPADTLWQVPDPWGFYSGAEGYARTTTPIDIGEVAAADAASRLDCTHVSWPRVLANCPQPGQRPFGPAGLLFDEAVEASSTEEANEQAEAKILALMECQDPHNYMLTLEGNKFHLLGPSLAKVGEDACIPKGLHPAILHDITCTPIPGNGKDLDASYSQHVFIEVACCDPDDNAKKLILHQVPDVLTYDEVRTAKQEGFFGLAKGQQALFTLTQLNKDSEIWYIGSLFAGDVTGDADSDDPTVAGGLKDNRITVQAHSGPIVIMESCCPSSSSSSGSASGSSVGSSVGSAAPPSVGPSSGSDKSTAIVPDPLGRPGKDYIAFFNMEMPTPIFEDVRYLHIPGGSGSFSYEVCQRYYLCCHAGTVRIASAVDDRGRPLQCRLSGDGRKLRVRVPWWRRFFGRPREAVVRFTGIRKGFLDWRNPYRSAKQYEENEETLNSAYSGYGENTKAPPE